MCGFHPRPTSASRACVRTIASSSRDPTWDGTSSGGGAFGRSTWSPSTTSGGRRAPPRAPSRLDGTARRRRGTSEACASSAGGSGPSGHRGCPRAHDPTRAPRSGGGSSRARDHATQHRCPPWLRATARALPRSIGRPHRAPLRAAAAIRANARRAADSSESQKKRADQRGASVGGKLSSTEAARGQRTAHRSVGIGLLRRNEDKNIHRSLADARALDPK